MGPDLAPATLQLDSAVGAHGFDIGAGSLHPDLAVERVQTQVQAWWGLNFVAYLHPDASGRPGVFPGYPDFVSHLLHRDFHLAGEFPRGLLVTAPHFFDRPYPHLVILRRAQGDAPVAGLGPDPGDPLPVQGPLLLFHHLFPLS